MYLEQYALAYPTAKILAPQSTIARLSTKESIKGRISSDFKSLETQYPGELKICDFKDSFRNEDVAILVVEEKTLIQADLLFNLPATEQYSKTGISASVPILNSFSAGSKFHKAALWYALVSNK